MSCPGWRNPRAPPLGPRQRRCLCTRKGEPPLDLAARFLRRLAAEENAWRIVKDRGGCSSRWCKGRSFSTLHRNGLPSRSLPPVESLGEVGGGVRGGGGRDNPSSEGFPPSSSGTSRPPLSGCPALAPFGDDSPLLLAERQELVGQQRIGEGKVGTLMHTA